MKYLVSLFLIFSSCLNADFQLSAEAQPLITVSEHANLQSGAFFHGSLDLETGGDDKLSFTQFYDTSTPCRYLFGRGQGADIPLRLFYEKYTGNVFLEERMGFEIPFFQQKGKTWKPSRKLFEKGYTNISRSRAKGQSHLRNTFIKKIEEGTWRVYTGDGSEREYRFMGSKDGSDAHRLTWEKRPNGNLVLYEYSSLAKPSKISLWTHDQAICLAWISFEEQNLGNSRKKLILTANNGKVTEHITSSRKRYIPGRIHGWKGVEGIPMLESVRYADQPEHTFKTPVKAEAGCSFKYSGIFLPDGSGMRMQYSKSNSALKTLQEPIGENGKYVSTHLFHYFPDGTRVYLPYYHLKNFGIKAGRLTYQMDYFKRKPYRKKFYTWKSDLLQEFGLAVGGQVLGKTRFTYDSQCNVSLEETEGNLTGNGQDKRVHHYVHSLDRNLLIEETDAEGLQTHYSYLPGTSLPVEKVVGNQLRSTWRYDEHRLLVEQREIDGVSERITRRTLKFVPGEYGWGHPASITKTYVENGQEKLLQRICYEYGKGDVITREDVYGSDGEWAYAIERKYDDLYRLTYETDPEGRATRYAYDQAGRLAEQELIGSGKVLRYTYDQAGRLIQEEDGDFVTTHTYNLISKRTSTTDPYGRTTRWEYDELGRLTKEIDPLGHSTSYTYDVYDNVTSTTDALGNTTLFTFTGEGKLLSQTDPDGTTERFLYTLEGRIAKKWDKEGVCTEYSYDVLGNCLEERTEERILTHRYVGKTLVESTDSMGYTTRYSYDGAGRLIGEEKEGRRIRYGYDALGRRSHTYYSDRTDYSVYDNLNRLVEEGNEQRVIRYAYDIQGNVILEDHGGRVTQKTYDTHNRLIELQDATGKCTQYRYSHENGQKTILQTEASKRVTREVYDACDQLVLRDKGDSLTTYSFDALGRKIEEVHHTETPRVLRWSYDALGRETQISDQGRLTKFSYSPSGAITTKLQANGKEIRYSYNTYGQLIELQADDIHYRYSYDLNGNCILSEDLLTGVYTQKEYNPHGEMTHERQGSGLHLELTRDNYGRITEIYLPENGKLVYQYQGVNLHAIQRISSDSQILYSHQYLDFDLSGNPLKSQLVNQAIQEQHWDSLGRNVLTRSPYHQHSLDSFDLNDNLTQETLNGRTTHYVHDDLDQLIQEGDSSYTYDTYFIRLEENGESYQHDCYGQVIRKGSCTYSYDLNGNRLSEGGRRYTYDALNRLVRVEEGSTTIAYTYDAEGRIIQRNSEQIFYVGKLDIATYENGSCKNLRLCGLDRTVAVEMGGQAYVVLSNHRGDVLALVDEYGQIQESDYSAFGKGPVISPWGFNGKRYDFFTGCYLFPHRHYDPDLGTWLSPDPAGYVDGPNLLAYVQNNPLLYIDPLGLKREDLSKGSSHNPFLENPIVGFFIGGIRDLYRSYYYRNDRDYLDSVGLNSWNDMSFAQKSGMVALAGMECIPAAKGFKLGRLAGRVTKSTRLPGATEKVGGKILQSASTSLVKKSPRPIGLADDAAKIVLSNINRVDHSARHLIDAGLINAASGSKAARSAFQKIGHGILTKPTKTFDHVMSRGGQPVKGFYGQVNNNDIVIFLAKNSQGKVRSGDIVTSIIPSTKQIKGFGL